MATVASDAVLFVKALGLESVAVLGWSGGAPYALAASERLGPVVRAVHLVSPLPGPLIGPIDGSLTEGLTKDNARLEATDFSGSSESRTLTWRTSRWREPTNSWTNSGTLWRTASGVAQLPGGVNGSAERPAGRGTAPLPDPSAGCATDNRPAGLVRRGLPVRGRRRVGVGGPRDSDLIPPSSPASWGGSNLPRTRGGRLTYTSPRGVTTAAADATLTRCSSSFRTRRCPRSRLRKGSLRSRRTTAGRPQTCPWPR
jgi:pimeloyl-ACP methyl ester carboxylesterase